MAVTIQLKNNGSTGQTTLPSANGIEHGEVYLDTVNGEISFVNENQDAWHTVSPNPAADFSSEITVAGGIGNAGSDVIVHDNLKVYNGSPKLTIKGNTVNANGKATLELYFTDTSVSGSNYSEPVSWLIEKDNSAGSTNGVDNGRLEFNLKTQYYSSPWESTSLKAYLQTNGQLWSYGHNNISSRELKQNIEALPEQVALENFLALNPVTFEYKEHPEDSHIGFIAEDVPECFADSERRGISSLNIVATMTKVVQKQEKEIDELRKEIKELKNLILNL